jgi:hypothetical protein
MLQDMDHMEVCCVLYVKVGRFDQLEQRKICVLAVTDALRQSSPDAFFVSIKYEISAVVPQSVSL